MTENQHTSPTDGEQDHDGQDPAVVVDQVQDRPAPAPAPADYDSPQWNRETLVTELVRTRRELLHLESMMQRLSQWLLEHVPHEITPERGDVDAVSVAVRVLEEFVNHPNGRLEGPVREALDKLDKLRGADDEEIIGQVEVARAHLARALTAPPRPGGGPAPVYEDDDITVVRYDRDRLRMELDLSYRTIADMFRAATGRADPHKGVVEDLADVHARGQAAEHALMVALAARGDGEASVPAKGTEAYTAWTALIREVVSGVVDSRLAPIGGAAMPIAGGKP